MTFQEPIEPRFKVGSKFLVKDFLLGENGIVSAWIKVVRIGRHKSRIVWRDGSLSRYETWRNESLNDLINKINGVRRMINIVK